jgi:formylglycine-generating enzyme required for sulfatase activity
MAGNVWEWTRSLARPYPYDARDGREDSAAPGARVVRGGSYNHAPHDIRCSARDWLFPGACDVYIGMRLVRHAAPPPGDPHDWVHVPPGELHLGDWPVAVRADAPEEALPGLGTPAHAVWVPAFALAATPVTNRQYARFVQATGRAAPAHWSGARPPESLWQHPVTYVDWHDAVAFCRKLTVQERAGGWLEKGEHYRLPTEAEWEYACRAGTKSAWSFGADPRKLSDYAWHYGNTSDRKEAYAHRVGRKKPNPWGLCDMHGNVYEWCSDWYKSTLVGGENPQGPSTGTMKVLRGGGWGYDPARCRSADRNKNDPSFTDFSGGFRIVLAAE